MRLLAVASARPGEDVQVPNGDASSVDEGHGVAVVSRGLDGGAAVARIRRTIVLPVYCVHTRSLLWCSHVIARHYECQ